MNRPLMTRSIRNLWPALLLAAWPIFGVAQVAVPEIQEIDELPMLPAGEVEELIGPIALYPDDLLAIVLPATTYPLQIVEAGRFLEDLESDSSLEPDEDWDDSVVALLNYPEVVEMLNDDLDWTWRLGEAVVNQQSDVIAAIEDFRDRAYAAGNLQSDDYQLVAEEEGAISITPVQEDVIYVPYYEPEQVVVYQPRPVYFYYPRPYPVYYYPYPSWYTFGNHFHHSWFWGVTTAFSIGWHSHNLSVYHQSFYGHPYYGHTYWDRYWYRRPDIHIYNTTYVRNNTNVNVNRHRDGDRWLPRDRRTVNTDQRITRTRYYPNSTSRGGSASSTFNNVNRAGQVARSTTSPKTPRYTPHSSEREPIEFRKRPTTSRAAPDRTETTRLAPTRRSEPGATSVRPSPPRVSPDFRAKPSTARPSEPSRQPVSRSSSSSREPAVRSGSSYRQPDSRPNSSSRQPAARPSSSSRQPAARPSSTSRQPASRPSSSSRQPASRPSSSSRQPASRPSSSSRQPASRPSSSSRKSASSNRSGESTSQSKRRGSRRDK